MDPNRICVHYTPWIARKECNVLISPMLKEEARRAVLSMRSFKASGPDAFPPFFFKNYWDVVVDDLWWPVADAFRNGYFDYNLVETLIVLIPTGEWLVHLREFRPISFCNMVYKVITKVLVNHLRPYLNDLIGLCIVVLFLREVLLIMSLWRRKCFILCIRIKSRKVWLLLKIDIGKAYNRGNWDS